MSDSIVETDPAMEVDGQIDWDCAWIVEERGNKRREKGGTQKSVLEASS